MDSVVAELCKAAAPPEVMGALSLFRYEIHGRGRNAAPTGNTPQRPPSLCGRKHPKLLFRRPRHVISSGRSADAIMRSIVPGPRKPQRIPSIYRHVVMG
jgi:hypothetical protein